MPFVKGQSGNPSGRARIPEEIRTMLKSAAPAALQLLIETAADEGTEKKLRIDCAKTLLDRAYGKPEQGISVDAAVGATVLSTQMSADEMLEAIRSAAKAMEGITHGDNSDSTESR